MKIVFASTPEQEEKVNELVRYFYTNIFPVYFTDSQIREFEQQHVLEIKNNCVNESFDTLGDGYKAIASLQTIIAILETYDQQGDYKAIFEKNVSLLSEVGIHFPFTFEMFEYSREINRIQMFSIYAKPTNQYLI